MKLIVGLGNPGALYKGTRHNAGASAVERLAKYEKFVFKPDRSFKSQIATGKIADTAVAFVLPQTFMNLSGDAVGAFVTKKRIAIEDILVVYDDVNLSCGELKVKPKGSDGGHHGLASIVARLGTRDIARIRLGIGAPGLSGDLTDFVLSKFDRNEQKISGDMLESACDAIRVWAEEGIDAAMNRFNTKTKR